MTGPNTGSILELAPVLGVVGRFGHLIIKDEVTPLHVKVLVFLRDKNLVKKQ